MRPFSLFVMKGDLRGNSFIAFVTKSAEDRIMNKGRRLLRAANPIIKEEYMDYIEHFLNGYIIIILY